MCEHGQLNPMFKNVFALEKSSCNLIVNDLIFGRAALLEILIRKIEMLCSMFHDWETLGNLV